MLVGVGLVVLGSVLHAVWNLLVKRSGEDGTAFAWLYSALVTAVLVLLLLVRSGASAGLVTTHWWAALVSAGLHTVYAVVLQRSYAAADLTVVYPVARAGAPILVALASVALFDAWPGPGAWVGVALIAVGISALVGGGQDRERPRRRGAIGGSATAVAIASYTLWDGYAMTRLDVDVLSYLAIGSLAQLMALTLAVAPAPHRFAEVARSAWRAALPLAALVPLSYGLVLAAMERIDVHVVAAIRSTSILAASVLGWWLLGEPRTRRRTAGAVLTSLGVAVAALG